MKIDVRVSDANLVMAAATCRARSQGREVGSTGRGGGECSEGIACEVYVVYDALSISQFTSSPTRHRHISDLASPIEPGWSLASEEQTQLKERYELPSHCA